MFAIRLFVPQLECDHWSLEIKSIKFFKNDKTNTLEQNCDYNGRFLIQSVELHVPDASPFIGIPFLTAYRRQ